MFNEYKKYLTYLPRNVSFSRKLKSLEWGIRQHDLWAPFPIFAKIEITTFCNLNCIMCAREKITNPKHMSYDTFVDIVDRLGMGICEIWPHGFGEPLLNPDYFKMMQYLKEKGILFGLSTNGVLLNESRRKQLLELNPVRIRFSIDAGEKIEYERIRVGANYDKVKENLIETVELRNEMYAGKSKYKTPLIYIYATLNMDNLNQIDKLIELKNETGADYLNIMDITYNYDYGTSTKDKAIRVQLKEEELDVIINQYESEDILVKIKQLEKRVCDSPKAQCYINIEGDVWPCTCVAGDMLPSIGNIFDVDNIGKLYRNDKWNDFREKSACGDIKACKTCLSWASTLKGCEINDN